LERGCLLDPALDALQIFRYQETGLIRMLWISATNPAVSLPNVARVRKILANPELFIVVQDAFMTEPPSSRMSPCRLHCGAKRPAVRPLSYYGRV
jgi:hypothetical protein